MSLTRQAGAGGSAPPDARDSAPAPRRLNLGCGTDLRAGWINLDKVDYGGNRVLDLDRAPWPFPDSHFDEVCAWHILEHLENFNRTVTEIWRVTRPGGRVDVRAPFFLSTKYYSEPDHRVPFGIRSFDNYEEVAGRRLRFYERWKLGHRTNYGSAARFVVESRRFHLSSFRLLRWMNALVNVEPVFYERFLATWLVPEEVWFRLRVVKKD